MYNANIPKDQEVPSTGQLIRSTILAALVAGVLLACVVLPAEYGIDPTGLGQVIGLTRMGEIKQSLAAEEKADRAKDLAALEQPQADAAAGQPALTADGSLEPASHEMQITLAPDEGTEIKTVMQKGGRLEYEWWTDGGAANFDVHGDSRALGIDYHSYGKGSEERAAGSIEAAFDGSHGWFWRNRGSTPMTITLKTSGAYSNIKQMK
jgi:hypothetical protein